MNVVLDVFAGEAIMARIAHTPLDDGWSLDYDTAWTGNPPAFPLSPPLPLQGPERGYDSRSVRRFIEHLLPEGHALDVAVKAHGLATKCRHVECAPCCQLLNAASCAPPSSCTRNPPAA